MTSMTVSRWYALRPHAEQRRVWQSEARFKVVPAGRRSGKTELAKRYGIRRAMVPQRHGDARYIFCAPTWDQARRIFWMDVKKLTPAWAIAGGPSKGVREGDMEIRLVNGATVYVTGLDRPERIEGNPIDWVGVDEIGNCRPSAWPEHIRPALSERGGQAWLFGVPEGRNHYWDMAQQAQIGQAETPDTWAFFTWPSADILDAREIELAKSELDDLTFRQEYMADFVTFAGRCYYAFDRQTHATECLMYDPSRPLCLCFDFNVSPGVCAVVQDLTYTGDNAKVARTFTAVVDEVWIRRDSNTRKVCRAIAERYGTHPAEVRCYGDSTGGAKGTAKLQGSDWDIIRDCLGPVFRGRLTFRVPPSNPSERSRLNAMNSRLLSTDGTVHLLVDPRCVHVVQDFEGLALKADGSGEIDKRRDPALSHLSDAVGYHVWKEHPVGGPQAGMVWVDGAF